MKDFINSKEGARILKSVFVLIAVFTAFLVFEVVSVAKNLSYPNPSAGSITVTGTGDAISVPDIATFTFSVSADAKDVATAQSSVTAKTDDILTGLKGLGIADKDLKTTDYSIYPKYVYQNTVCPAAGICPPSRAIPDGYTVSQSVTVKVRNTADAGKALALVGEKGATNVSGLSFTMDDPEAPMNEARLAAIDDAKQKADVLAQRLGVHLVRVMSYYDNTSPQPYPVYDKAIGGLGGSAAAIAPSVPTGENKTTATVSVTYEIR